VLGSENVIREHLAHTEIDTNGTVVNFVGHDEYVIWGGGMCGRMERLLKLKSSIEMRGPSFANSEKNPTPTAAISTRTLADSSVCGPEPPVRASE